MEAEDEAVHPALGPFRDPPAFGHGYLPGQQIVTRGGRSGVLTGGADGQHNPYVHFDPDSSTPSSIPKGVQPAWMYGRGLCWIDRDGITGPVAHVFDDSRQAYDLSQTMDVIRNGDVLVVPSEGIVAVLWKAYPIAVNPDCEANHGALHTVTGGPQALAAGGLADSVGVAQQIIAQLLNAGPARRNASPGWLSGLTRSAEFPSPPLRPGATPRAQVSRSARPSALRPQRPARP